MSDRKPIAKNRQGLRRWLRWLGIVAVILLLAVAVVVAYVELAWKRDFSATPLPNLAAIRDPEVIARGAYIAHTVAHCSGCHQPADMASRHELATNLDDLRGGLVMDESPFGIFGVPNITPEAETGLGAWTDAELAREVRFGVGRTGKLDPIMSMMVGPMADEDLVALLSYLRSITPVRSVTQKDEWGFVAKALSSRFEAKRFATPPFVKEGGTSVERGRYLAKGPAFCFGCHSPFDIINGFVLTGPEFSGPNRPEPDHADLAYEVMPPNLTSDSTGVLSNFTEDSFVDRFKKVRRTVLGSHMPWENFSRMTDEDLRSIYRYLKTLPPVNHATGPTRRPRGSWKG